MSKLKLIKMKLKYIIPLIGIALFTACSTDNDDTPINEIENLIKVQDFVSTNHTIELFSETGLLNTGYNTVSLRIKDNTNDHYVETASISWMPMMQMPSMQHSCPKSVISKVQDKNTLYNGFLIFQMTGANGSGWTLKFNYTIDG